MKPNKNNESSTSSTVKKTLTKSTKLTKLNNQIQSNNRQINNVRNNKVSNSNNQLKIEEENFKKRLLSFIFSRIRNNVLPTKHHRLIPNDQPLRLPSSFNSSILIKYKDRDPDSKQGINSKSAGIRRSYKSKAFTNNITIPKALPLPSTSKSASTPKVSPSTSKSASTPNVSPSTSKSAATPNVSPSTSKSASTPKVSPTTSKSASTPNVSPSPSASKPGLYSSKKAVLNGSKLSSSSSTTAFKPIVADPNKKYIVRLPNDIVVNCLSKSLNIKELEPNTTIYSYAEYIDENKLPDCGLDTAKVVSVKPVKNDSSKLLNVFTFDGVSIGVHPKSIIGVKDQKGSKGSAKVIFKSIGELKCGKDELAVNAQHQTINYKKGVAELNQYCGTTNLERTHLDKVIALYECINLANTDGHSRLDKRNCCFYCNSIQDVNTLVETIQNIAPTFEFRESFIDLVDHEKYGKSYRVKVLAGLVQEFIRFGLILGKKTKDKGDCYSDPFIYSGFPLIISSRGYFAGYSGDGKIAYKSSSVNRESSITPPAFSQTRDKEEKCDKYGQAIVSKLRKIGITSTYLIKLSKKSKRYECIINFGHGQIHKTYSQLSMYKEWSLSIFKLFEQYQNNVISTIRFILEKADELYKEEQPMSRPYSLALAKEYASDEPSINGNVEPSMDRYIRYYRTGKHTSYKNSSTLYGLDIHQFMDKIGVLHYFENEKGEPHRYGYPRTRRTVPCFFMEVKAITRSNYSPGYSDVIIKGSQYIQANGLLFKGTLVPEESDE